MKKLIYIGAVTTVFLVLYIIDYAVARQYSIELVSLTPQKIEADGQSTAKMSVRLTKGGKAVSGHTLYVFPSAGAVSNSYIVTNKDGKADITYYSYYYIEGIIPINDVTVFVENQTNSFIIQVPAKAQFVIEITVPDELGVTEDWQDITE